jgi:hypothetical protein
MRERFSMRAGICRMTVLGMVLVVAVLGLWAAVIR